MKSAFFIYMNEHTFKILEFDKLIEYSSKNCVTELGKKKYLQIKPFDDIERVRYTLQETEEMKSVIDQEGNVPFRQIFDISTYLLNCKKGQVLNEAELLKTATTFSSLKGLFDFLLSLNKDKSMLIARKLTNIRDFSPVSSKIFSAVDYDGKVKDSASSNLNSIRNEIRISEIRIKEKINQIATGSKYRSYLSDPIVTLRNGRYCVPVKSEYKSQVPGIVHDSSGSGQTLFVEPGIIVDMGNRLKDAYGRERDEIYKILSALSDFVASYSDDGLYALDISADLDVIFAKALFSYEIKGIKPHINDKGRINLIGARHPLLYLKNRDCVPIDVSLGNKFDCLLITGPNTGGKTVTLKTVGTLVLLAMCGLFVPCEAGSDISVFREIFTDIGDEQSIEQSLSTFSSHLKNIKYISENSDRNSLVLLDELGAGTDPVEGSALARAIIEDLLAKNAKIIATTHYGELKNFAFITERVENGSVEFDNVSLKPTYKLLIGVPGSSNALHIAKRMGINQSVIDRADEVRNKNKDAGQEIIDKIEAVHNEAGRDRIEAAKRLKEIENLKKDYSEKLARLQHKESVIEDKIKKRANKIIREYTNKIGETLEALKKTDSENSERQSLKKQLNSLVDDFQFEIRKPMKTPEKEEERPPVTEVHAGDTVWVKSLDMAASVVEYKNDSNIVVAMGSMTMTVKKDGLAKVSEETSKHKTNQVSGFTLQKAANFRPEIRLLGMRVEEAIFELDKFVDNAVTSNAQSFRVVHGKGTGALKSAVHIFLRECPSVKSFEICEPNEGGDGATKVYL